jgi:hypothetical protein
LVTLKVQYKNKDLFNKPAAGVGMFNKCSCLAAALGVTKFYISAVLIKSDMGVAKDDILNIQVKTKSNKNYYNDCQDFGHTFCVT